VKSKTKKKEIIKQIIKVMEHKKAQTTAKQNKIK